MIGKMLLSGAVMLSLVASGAVTASAEPTNGGEAAKPAADTKEPGKTATDAVTNPAVPPSEGSVGNDKPVRPAPPSK